ncbi:5087_t:CDS:2 [Ambispora gerdemannii]|uniref:5087_t:CDS:1 n=1 Tax=Ambispora gerdemannii TaxID=144530 RepID=A0A9N9FEP5_9GLOM|nr:5087_t:CDS:2 [Ambispora gerdemannii]
MRAVHYLKVKAATGHRSDYPFTCLIIDQMSPVFPWFSGV